LRTHIASRASRDLAPAWACGVPEQQAMAAAAGRRGIAWRYLIVCGKTAYLAWHQQGKASFIVTWWGGVADSWAFNGYLICLNLC